MSERFFGCHVSAAGGLENGLKNGDTLGINTIQVHPCPPQKWNFKPFDDSVGEKFNEYKKQSQVKKVFFHGIYLINLANPDPRQNQMSRQSLINDLNLMGQIGGDGVIFHIGSMKHLETEEEAFTLIAESIDRILEESAKNSRLLLEVAAGSGQVMGARFEQLSAIYGKISCKERVGFALDTQHMWASGYNLQTDLDKIISNLESAFTFEKIFAIHLNDSMTACDSRKDRHENLGDGQIGEVALKAFINHPKVKSIPVILETPAMKSMETAAEEAKKLGEWIA